MNRNRLEQGALLVSRRGVVAFKQVKERREAHEVVNGVNKSFVDIGDTLPLRDALAAAHAPRSATEACAPQPCGRDAILETFRIRNVRYDSATVLVPKYLD